MTGLPAAKTARIQIVCACLLTLRDGCVCGGGEAEGSEPPVLIPQEPSLFPFPPIQRGRSKIIQNKALFQAFSSVGHLHPGVHMISLQPPHLSVFSPEGRWSLSRG